MNFRTLKPILFLAIIATFTMACKEANTTNEKVKNATTVEQNNDAHDHPHSDAGATPEKSLENEVALNPAHGQPGHRCDIAVGQPLNSQPKPQNNAKVNPPHGQPGHRCDLAVGAPLPE